MIGILTFQSTNNFGAHLHTIALYNKVKELGYDCEIIDYLCPALLKRETDEYRLSANPKRLLWYIFYGHTLKDKYCQLSKELRKYSQVGPSFTPGDIVKANSRYSGFLVGSDVVWSLRVSDYDYNYFLAFAQDNKVLNAFSSSVGETEMYRDDLRLPGLLQRFSKIAVRDEEAVGWVKQISGKDAAYVCDPTMLYTGEEWDKILAPKRYDGDYILIYFTDPQGKMNYDAIQYAKANGYNIKVVNYGKPVAGMETVRPKTLAEFVGLIKYCKALFTASYHGMLFSLYYQRELYYYNRSLKGRMSSLASKLGIEDHDGDLFSLDTPFICYESVNTRINMFRENSLTVLKDILKEYGNN